MDSGEYFTDYSMHKWYWFLCLSLFFCPTIQFSSSAYLTVVDFYAFSLSALMLAVEAPDSQMLITFGDKR